MEQSTENNNKQGFLKEGFKKNVSKHHEEYLGISVPDNYFAKTKISILDKIKEEAQEEIAPKKQIVFYLRPQFKYFAAASLVFLFSLTIWLQNANNQDELETISIDSFAFQDDVLIESLLIEDFELDAFTDSTLFNEIVVKAEMSEQKMDDLILNSLIVDDSLLDNYIDDELLESIIL